MMKLNDLSKDQLIELLQKANKRRKHDAGIWKIKANGLAELLQFEREEWAKECNEQRGWINHYRGQLSEMKEHEVEYQQWRSRVDELVNREAQAHKDLFALQECSGCEVKKRNKRLFPAVNEFMTRYIHIVDDLLRQKNLPDNVKARLCDMRIAIADSREFMENLRKENL